MSKIIAKNSKGEGLLSMKESPKVESKKSSEQKSEELCNFLKNAFCVDGDVLAVESDKPLKGKVWFLLEDSKRGKFAVLIKSIKDN